MSAPEIDAAASTVMECHEAVKVVNELLAHAGRGQVVDCLGIRCLLALIEQQLFSAADALAPYTGIEPQQ